MASSYLSPRTPREARRRTASLALAILAHALLIWLLLHVSPTLVPMGRQRPLATFDLDREPGSKPKAEKREKTVAKRKSAARAAQAAQPKAERQQQPVDRPPTPTPPNLSLFGRNSPLANVDLGKIKSAPDEAEAADSGEGSGKNSGSVYGPGAGPGGARLFNAQWYRRPTHAELAGYMPHHDVPPGSWGDIACRTIPGNQVENCQSLGESPPGSGIARSLRLAAWQFRIIPPRVDGKPVIGAWVRIHFYFTEDGDAEAK